MIKKEYVMKTCCCLFAVVLLLSSCALAGDPKVIYEAGDKLNAHFYLSDKGQNSELDEIDGEPVLWLEYNRAEAPWFSMQFRAPDRSNVAGPFKSAKTIFEVYLPEEAGASWLNMRIVDKDGETIQYGAKIEPTMQGWVSLTATVDAQKPSSTWGGNVSNKVIDFPARFTEITIDFRNKTATGRLAIRRILVEEEEE